MMATATHPTRTRDETFGPFASIEVVGSAEKAIERVNSPPYGRRGDERFGGQAVIDEFTDLRWITVQSGTHPFPF